LAIFLLRFALVFFFVTGPIRPVHTFCLSLGIILLALASAGPGSYESIGGSFMVLGAASLADAASSKLPAMSANPNGDIEVVNPPTDSISSIAFSPTADLLTAGSWDGSVSTPNFSCVLAP